MRFLGAKPKNISVLIDMDLDKLLKVRWCLENCEVSFNGDDKQEKDNAEYFGHEFYEEVCDMIIYAEQQLGIKED
jgi:hypothetical protein